MRKKRAVRCEILPTPVDSEKKNGVTKELIAGGVSLWQMRGAGKKINRNVGGTVDARNRHGQRLARARKKSITSL
jgi:hypothetical protein